MKRRVGSTDLSRLLEQCCHCPGQCYFTRQGISLDLTFVIVQKCTLTWAKQRVPFTLLLHVAMQMGLYLHQRLQVRRQCLACSL
jgi:hypothetical protein